MSLSWWALIFETFRKRSPGTVAQNVGFQRQLVELEIIEQRLRRRLRALCSGTPGSLSLRQERSESLKLLEVKARFTQRLRAQVFCRSGLY